MTDTHQEQVNIRDITLDKTLQVRSAFEAVDRSVVERYAACFDDLPPVEVVETPEGKLLADGFHRVAAAKQIGRVHITANVRTGTREDAEVIGLLANTTHGVPLRSWERERAILRLHTLRPEWSNRELARKMGVSEGTVRNLLKNQKIRVELKEAGVPHVAELNDTVRAQIYAVPPELQRDVAKAAYERRWKADQVREVVKVVTDPTLPEVDKRLALAGVLPEPKTPEQQEEEEQRRLDTLDKLRSFDPFNIRGQTNPGVAVMRKGASSAMYEILDKLLTQEPRALAASLDKHERAVWAQYLQRVRRWMEDFEDATAEHHGWVLDDDL